MPMGWQSLTCLQLLFLYRTEIKLVCGTLIQWGTSVQTPNWVEGLPNMLGIRVLLKQGAKSPVKDLGSSKGQGQDDLHRESDSMLIRHRREKKASGQGEVLITSLAKAAFWPASG